MRLENRIALITGAGSGQGAAAARLFSAEGASVVVFDRDERFRSFPPDETGLGIGVHRHFWNLDSCFPAALAGDCHRVPGLDGDARTEVKAEELIL